MTIDERTRHEMCSGLEQHLGAEVADALMQYLPPVGWADVATKHDLAELEQRIDLRFDQLEAGIDLKLGAMESRLEASSQRLINRYTLWLFPTMLTALTLAVLIGQAT